MCYGWHLYIHRKVASRSLFRLVAHFQILRRLMKEKFDAYVLWPLAKKFQNWIVDWSTARNFMVYSECYSTHMGHKRSVQEIRKSYCPNISTVHTGFNGTPLYSYMCFKEEVLLGYLSCIIMVLPGVLLSALIIYNLNKKSQTSYVYVAIMASPLLWVSFPFLAFIVRVRRIKGGINTLDITDILKFIHLFFFLW